MITIDKIEIDVCLEYVEADYSSDVARWRGTASRGNVTVQIDMPEQPRSQMILDVIGQVEKAEEKVWSPTSPNWENSIESFLCRD